MSAGPTMELIEREARTMAEWISVKERLPEDFVHVLTCDGRGHIHVMEHIHGYAAPFNVGPDHKRYFPVTYWMPLPEPPKEEGGHGNHCDGI